MHDQTFIETIREEIKNTRKSVHLQDKNLLWDFLKSQIRAKAISYSKYIAKKTKKRELQVQNKLELLEKQIVNQPCKLPEYYKINSEWERIQNSKSAGIIMRSKAKCVEEGEKNTKYFLNLEKKIITQNI